MRGLSLALSIRPLPNPLPRTSSEPLFKPLARERGLTVLTPNLILTHALLAWYDQYGRKDLPWRQHISAYRVYISEIMLQQTQVKTVIPYFLRFMERFPNIETLAAADLDEVLHHWTGLGYYSRARNLHRTAQQVCQRYGGEFPRDLTALQDLPGIGRSTAGAIMAIAMNKRAAILDGNVKRILTRLHAISGSTASVAVANQLWNLATDYTPNTRVSDYTQAIMDLGATICTRTRPDCPQCPWQTACLAYQQNATTSYPSPKTKKESPLRVSRWLIFYRDHSVLLYKRPPVGVWAGLWSFPECPIDVNINDWCQQHFGYEVKQWQTKPTFRHVFSHFRWDITPVILPADAFVDRVMDSTDWVWYKITHTPPGGFASPVQRLLLELAER